MILVVSKKVTRKVIIKIEIDSGEKIMKAYFLWTVIGPQIILTSCDLEKDPGCLLQTGRAVDSLARKVMAYEVPLDTIKERYGEHFESVLTDPDQTDELRILDSNGEHVLNNIHFSELGKPIYYEPESAKPQGNRYSSMK